jgi:hypothetical protein
MAVNFNAMILPKFGTAMIEGDTARQNALLKDQQMANSQQEMAMRQKEFGQKEAEYKYLVSERERVAAAMAAFNKHLEDSGGVPGPEGYRMLIDTRDPNLVKMGMTGFQMLADEKQLQDIFDKIHGRDNTSTPSQPKNNVGITYAPTQGPQNAQGRPSLLPQPENFSVAPPTNALAAPQNNVGMTLEPTNTLAAPQSRAPRNGYTQDDLIAFASARDPRGKDIATLLKGSTSLGAEYLQLVDRMKVTDPKTPEGIWIQNRINFLTSAEARTQPQRPELGTAEGTPGKPKVAYQITPGMNGPRVDTVPIPGTEKPTQAENLDVKDIADRNKKYVSAKTAVEAFKTKAAEHIANLKKLADHPGLNGITGVVYGRTPSLTGDARAAEVLFNQVVGTDVLETIMDIKRQSPTGASPLGQVTDSDRETVKSTTGFSRILDKKDLRDQLLAAAAKMEGVSKRTQQAFDDTYAYKQDGASAPPTDGGGKPPDTTPAKDPYANLPRVTNNDDFKRLPSGAEFIAPDNTRRRKP